MISTTATTARRLGRIAMVGAVALLLTGGLAAPAGAMKREDARAFARNYASMCMSIGGDPAVEDSPANGGISMMCLYDGTYYWHWQPYEDADGGGGRSHSRRGDVGEQSIAADDANGNAEDADKSKRQKAQKHHKAKTHAAKRG